MVNLVANLVHQLDDDESSWQRGQQQKQPTAGDIV